MAQLRQDRRKKSLSVVFLQKQGPVGEHQKCQDLAPLLLLLQAQALYAKQQSACVNWGDDAIITQTICYTCTHWKHTPKPEFLKNLQLWQIEGIVKHLRSSDLKDCVWMRGQNTEGNTLLSVMSVCVCRPKDLKHRRSGFACQPRTFM